MVRSPQWHWAQRAALPAAQPPQEAAESPAQLTAQHSAAQRSTAQHSTARHGPAPPRPRLLTLGNRGSFRRHTLRSPRRNRASPAMCAQHFRKTKWSAFVLQEIKTWKQNILQNSSTLSSLSLFLCNNSFKEDPGIIFWCKLCYKHISLCW